MEQDAGPAEPADAAAAFEALRREVALLNVAVAGLAAERAPAPDYSETLGDIAKGVSVAVGRLGKVIASPAFALSPADLARHIVAASDEARRQDRMALNQAQDALQRTASDLRGWVDSARLASAQSRRLIQAGSAGLLAGAFLGIWLPVAIARLAPERWLWPEALAARVLQRDTWSAGERMLTISDAVRWQAFQACRSDPGRPNSQMVSQPRRIIKRLPGARRPVGSKVH